MNVSSWKPEHANRYRLLVLVIITAAGFAIRLHELDHDSFWIDEILTVRSVRSGIQSILRIRDHPPLFYGISTIPFFFLNEGEFAARLVSLVAGTLAIPAIAYMGKVMKATNAGIWAALLLALSPFHLHYSQEARSYALLMLLSLLSYSFLYSAMQRSKWSRWLAYTAISILNLYTHFGALIVLATQSVLIAVWSINRLINRQVKELAFPVISAGIMLVLYAPWISRFLAALDHNVGSDASTGTGGVEPLSRWLEVLYPAFGMYSDILKPILFGLCILGLLYWLFGKDWFNLGFMVAGLMMPLLLILLFQVARGAYARFVIYLLPFYLLPAGYAIDRSLMFTRQYVGKIFHKGLVFACAFGFIVLGQPLISNEYEHVPADWKNVIAYIEQNSETDYLIASLSINNSTGFNSIKASLPYYLEEADINLTILEGNKLGLTQIEKLADRDVPIWWIVESWRGSPVPEEDSLNVASFKTNIYVLYDNNQEGPVLDRLILMYENVIHKATSPSPLCFMERDLATLYLAAGEHLKAEQSLAESVKLCPELDPLPAVAIYEGLLQGQPSIIDADQGLEYAKQILTNDPKNVVALDYLSTTNLLDHFNDGKAKIIDDNSPEPVQTKRFTMPQNGDWGDVLFIHPPATASFNLSLPDESTTFASRIALAPDSWGWGGDGVTFVVRIQDETGTSTELFRQHIGNDAEQNGWHDVFIPLNNFAGQEIELTLSTESGPAGDGTGDWAGWETPRIMWGIP